MTENNSTANIREVYKLTGDLQANMNTGFERIEKQIADLSLKFALQTEVKELTKRVSKLEQWRWYLIGAFAVLLGLATYFGNELRSLIFKN